MTNDVFERLARAHGDAIFRVAFHALGNRADAEDVSQTVLLKLYQTDKSFAGDDHAKHWLIRVTVNECRKLLRTPWRKRILPLEDYDGPSPVPEDHSDVLAALCITAFAAPAVQKMFMSFSVTVTPDGQVEVSTDTADGPMVYTFSLTGDTVTLDGEALTGGEIGSYIVTDQNGEMEVTPAE